jgi:hypothetical protein
VSAEACEKNLCSSHEQLLSKDNLISKFLKLSKRQKEFVVNIEKEQA